MTFQFTISKKRLMFLLMALVLAIPTALLADTNSVGSKFSYQGQLILNGNLVNDSCDLTFALYDAVSAGNQVGSTLTKSGVPVANGLFTVELDFGVNAFTGDSRWLEIAVKCSGEASFTTLAPRQALNPTPYAMYADEVGTMSFNNLSNVPTGLTDGDDDTTYSAGTGLSLSGNAFSLMTAYRLPQSCSNNQLAKWDGSAWTCADDSDTDSTYSAGTGIELSNSAFSLASGYQMPQSCSNNQVPKWNGSAWACADDNNTTYTAGNGLTLSNNQFSANFGDAANSTAEGNHTHPASDIASGTLDDARLSADVTHRNAAETISEDWDNTANPWADNEVADNLTISGGTIDNSVIGNTTPAAANVTDLSATGNTTLGDASSDQITVNGTLKITSGSPGAGKVLFSDGDGDVMWQTVPRTIQQVINVAKSGGDYTSIQAALDSITDASTTKPYLIRVAPGVYEEQVTMKEYVDIEGAGEEKTIIKYTDNSSASEIYALRGSNNAEIRFISVKCEANASYTYAIENNSASPALTHVTATASGGNDNRGIDNDSSSPLMNYVTASASGGAISYGLYNHDSSSPTMNHVTASASSATDSYGIRNDGSSPTMNYVNATASDGTTSNRGIYNGASSSPIMNNVTAAASGSGTNYGIRHESTSSLSMNNVTTTASGSNINYGIYNNNSTSSTMNNVITTASGGTRNYGIYHDSTSPLMNNIIATVSGGADNYGIYNYDESSPIMKNITVKASDGTGNNYAIRNGSSSSPTMTDVTAIASGGTDARGVYNENSSSSTMSHVVIRASGGTTNRGIYHADAGSSSTIHHSQITGATNSIYHNNAASVSKVAYSMLEGDLSATGTITCLNNYDENLAAVTVNCD